MNGQSTRRVVGARHWVRDGTCSVEGRRIEVAVSRVRFGAAVGAANGVVYRTHDPPIAHKMRIRGPGLAAGHFATSRSAGRESPGRRRGVVAPQDRVSAIQIVSPRWLGETNGGSHQNRRDGDTPSDVHDGLQLEPPDLHRR